MECESCGCKIQDGESFFVNIEGARLNVCPRCRRLGKLISSPYQPSKSNSSTPYQSNTYSGGSSLKEEFELIEHYGQKIRNARERASLSLNDLAKKIFEKESFLDRVEKQKTRPPESVIRKIEKELGIVLLEAVGDNKSNIQSSEISKKSFSGGITLGDILEIEKKKKK